MEMTVAATRQRFVEDFESQHWSMTELCERYGISRPTGYKGVTRYRHGGAADLADRSRAPHTCPHRMAAALEMKVLAARQKYRWGATKLLQVLRTQHPELVWPARSTLNALLERHQLLRQHRRRSKWTHPGAAVLKTVRPNQVWPADFKGHFRTRDGRYCYPLTVTDHFSRAVLACHGLRSVATAAAKPVFLALFREVGVPEAIRTDNGSPFASTGLHGLSPLNVWWMQQGIVHQRIRPASPQENGTHERMHRELKRETTRPAAATLRAQQYRFNAFVRRYNEERPHEALANRTPASVWTPSVRSYVERPAGPDYPSHLEVRRVGTGGTLWLHGHRLFLSHALQGHDIGLEEVGDGIWNIVYYRTLLGKLDERTGLITGM